MFVIIADNDDYLYTVKLLMVQKTFCLEVRYIMINKITIIPNEYSLFLFLSFVFFFVGVSSINNLLER